jgi:uncharacterized protein YodC (DUF2158 family)
MFNVGDLVRLKSGGAMWTVESVDGDVIECVRDDDGEVTRETFDAALLEAPPRSLRVRPVPWL